MRLGLLICLILGTASAGQQQSRMQEWLNSGTAGERVQRMASLGIDPEAAQSAAEASVAWTLIPDKSGRPLALLFMPCDTLYSSSLYLLQESDTNWHVVDHLDFDCHYDEKLSYKVTVLHIAGTDGILVHHECEAYGTGYLQQNFEVFAIVGTKLKLVLDTEENLKESGWPNRAEREQESSFSVSRSSALILLLRPTKLE